VFEQTWPASPVGFCCDQFAAPGLFTFWSAEQFLKVVIVADQAGADVETSQSSKIVSSQRYYGILSRVDGRIIVLIHLLVVCMLHTTLCSWTELSSHGVEM
jgi:hypothetical protein